MASDLHGSNACFKKCLMLVDELRADVLVLAGDFTGKYLVPYLKEGVSHFRVPGSKPEIQDLRDLSRWKSLCSDAGGYPIELDTGEEDHEAIRLLEMQVATRRITQWFDYGLREYSFLTVIAVPGNDDGPEVTRVIETHKWVTNVDGCVKKRNGYTFFGMGYSNPTPWSTPRELSEARIDRLLANLSPQLDTPARSIGVIHVPPINTGLDLVPELRRLPDGSLKATGNDPVHCGSIAVRRFIEKVSPLLVASGHCHSSEGADQIGRTVCINPGSAFDRARLKARFITLKDEAVVGQFPLVR